MHHEHEWNWSYLHLAEEWWGTTSLLNPAISAFAEALKSAGACYRWCSQRSCSCAPRRNAWPRRVLQRWWLGFGWGMWTIPEEVRLAASSSGYSGMIATFGYVWRKTMENWWFYLSLYWFPPLYVGVLRWTSSFPIAICELVKVSTSKMSAFSERMPSCDLLNLHFILWWHHLCFELPTFSS